MHLNGVWTATDTGSSNNIWGLSNSCIRNQLSYSSQQRKLYCLKWFLNPQSSHFRAIALPTKLHIITSRVEI